MALLGSPAAVGRDPSLRRAPARLPGVVQAEETVQIIGRRSRSGSVGLVLVEQILVDSETYGFIGHPEVAVKDYAVPVMQVTEAAGTELVTATRLATSSVDNTFTRADIGGDPAGLVGPAGSSRSCAGAGGVQHR